MGSRQHRAETDTDEQAIVDDGEPTTVYFVVPPVLAHPRLVPRFPRLARGTEVQTRKRR